MNAYPEYPPNYSEFDDLGTRTGKGSEELEEGFFNLLENGGE